VRVRFGEPEDELLAEAVRRLQAARRLARAVEDYGAARVLNGLPAGQAWPWASVNLGYYGPSSRAWQFLDRAWASVPPGHRPTEVGGHDVILCDGSCRWPSESFAEHPAVVSLGLGDLVAAFSDDHQTRLSGC
jgi:hypothetical protein